VIARTIANGNNPAIIIPIEPEVSIWNVKPDSIANRRWPAKILAPSRTPKERAFAKYEIISMTTNNGASHIGAPAGRNIEKKRLP